MPESIAPGVEFEPDFDVAYAETMISEAKVVNEISMETAPLAVIFEEEVPLAELPAEAVPQTGDTDVWYGLFANSVMALVVVSVCEKRNKKEQETA